MRILGKQISDDISEVDVSCSNKNAHVILHIAEAYGLRPGDTLAGWNTCRKLFYLFDHA